MTRLPVIHRSLVLLLGLLALLWAQVLGGWHRIEHLDGHSAHHDSALFADHDDSGRDCRLFDALSAGAGPTSADPVLPIDRLPEARFEAVPKPPLRSTRTHHACARAPPDLT